MERDTQIGTALLVLGAVLLVVPALFPVQPVLIHDTTPVTFDSPEEIESQPIEVVRYENLSESGQELYVQTLESGGEYTVSQGDGAPDFEYLTSAEHSEIRSETDPRPAVVVIKRPQDNDLPPADEPFAEDSPRDGPQDDQRREGVQRYDMMETTTQRPGLGAVPQLLRLGAALIAVLSVGVGGYLRARR